MFTTIPRNLALYLALSTAGIFGASQAAEPAPASWSTCFTPGQDCEGAIVGELDAARSEILVQAYGFTSRPIGDALTRAKQRGVEVRIIVDRSDVQGRGSLVPDMLTAGIPVLVDTVPGIAHNKILIIDRAEVITGSFNFTASAEHRNAENLLIVRHAALAAEYRANWERRAAASMPTPKE